MEGVAGTLHLEMMNIDLLGYDSSIIIILLKV